MSSEALSSIALGLRTSAVIVSVAMGIFLAEKCGLLDSGLELEDIERLGLV